MTYRPLPIAIGALALAVAPVVAHAGPLDIVPRGDIAYDLLGSLAAAGHLRGQTLADLFRGDRLYTRAEMAAFVRRAAAQPSPSRGDGVALRALENEFAPELHDDPAAAIPASSAGAARLTAEGKLRLLSGPAAADAIGRGSATLRVGGSGYAAINLGDWRDEWYDSNAVQHGYPLIETAYLRIDGRPIDIEIGRMPLRWGPGYEGGMLLSDTAPSIPQIRAEKAFVPGGWFRHLGTLHFEQFDGQFFENADPDALPDATGTRRYLVARRLETAGLGRWSLALAESMKSTRLPDPLAANLLPLYLYQNEVTASSRHHLLGSLLPHSEPDTYWKNYLGDINASYRVGGETGLSVYDDLLIDDLKAPPGLGFNAPTPSKVGEQVGLYAPTLLGPSGRVGLRLEYATIDAGTYTNTSLPVAYTAQGVPLGYPSGPNANVFFARLDLAATTRIKLAVEGGARRAKDASQPGGDVDRVGAYGTYALRSNAFVGLRVEHVHTHDAGIADTDRAELDAGIGI